MVVLSLRTDTADPLPVIARERSERSNPFWTEGLLRYARNDNVTGLNTFALVQ